MPASRSPTRIVAAAASPTLRGLPARCRAEVSHLHHFFQEWLGGRLPETDAAFARFSSALAPDFSMISPNGESRDRGQVLELLRGAHGCRGARFAIRCDQVVARPVTMDGCLVTYREWQRQLGEEVGRWSTAFLREDPAAPLGVSWVHVHETWILSEH